VRPEGLVHWNGKIKPVGGRNGQDQGRQEEKEVEKKVRKGETLPGNHFEGGGNLKLASQEKSLCRGEE